MNSIAPESPKLTVDEAIRQLRNNPQYADLVHYAYFGRDVLESGRRFFASAEFSEVQSILKGKIKGGTVVDIGAGTGIASYAFAQAGAAKVYAIEPDESDEVGRGAINRIKGNLPVQVIDAWANSIPLESQSVDIVYARQVLHHIPDLTPAMREFARLLKPNGIFIACREHVVDNPQQLAEFLANHPVHQLAGGENAYSLDAYLSSIADSGLALKQCLAQWDSIINSFPTVQSTEELHHYPQQWLMKKIGPVGNHLAMLPGINALIWSRINRPIAGRLYSFVASR